MTPADPQPGLYADTSGTPYEATRDKRGLYWLKKLGRNAHSSSPYPKPDFASSVQAGTFTFQLPTPI